jgi:hypothetical protein
LPQGKVATSKIHGDQRFDFLAFMLRRLRPLAPTLRCPPMGRLSHGANVATQLVNDVGELLGVGHFQVARAGQFDLLS